ncbi:Pre-mRNA-splicing factor SPF27 [Dipodascopsis tothii]|uniref:Pre-mRNA-splicing factor SPF27 n=1 Tax=Dipodascopsis tothii TaxID=44089 RepID=UPI0034CFA1E2
MTTAPIDSLPYLDQPPTAEERAAVEKLIIRELKKGGSLKKRGLHPSLEAVDPLKLSTVLQQEITRLEEGVDSLDGIDTNKYTSFDFDSEDESVKKSTLEKAYIALAHTQARQNNLDFLLAFGKNQWLISNDELEQYSKALDHEINRTNAATEELNKSRKLEQTAISEKLLYLQSRREQIVSSLAAIKRACEELEQQIAKNRGES